VPLADRNDRFLDGVERLGATIDGRAALACRAELIDAPVWPEPPVWLHGDLHPANILVHDGQVAAVIDFGDITSGDPATDLMVAWMLLPAATHSTFRLSAGGIDDDTWARGRAWALALAVAILNSSADTPLMAAIANDTLTAVRA
jgi:aminoglycoside phosphotransferase (APT) family kinase protein